MNQTPPHFDSVTGTRLNDRVTCGRVSTARRSPAVDGSERKNSFLLNALLTAFLLTPAGIYLATAQTNTQQRGTILLSSSGGGGTTLTTKGDIQGYSSLAARVPVGTNGQVLTADSTQALGVKWSAAGAGTAIINGTPTINQVALYDDATHIRGAGTIPLGALPAHTHVGGDITSAVGQAQAGLGNDFSTATSLGFAAQTSAGGAFISVGPDLGPSFMLRRTWEFLDAFQGTSPDNIDGLRVANANSGTTAFVSVDNAHWGVVELATPTATNASATLSTSGQNGFRLGGGVLNMEFLVHIPTLCDGTDDCRMQFGWVDNTPPTDMGTAGNNAVFFEYIRATDTHWRICACNSGAACTKTNTATTVATGWHKFSYQVNAAGTSIAYLIDGATPTGSPLSGANLPTTAGMKLALENVKTAGTTTRPLRFDYVSFWGIPTVAR